MKKLEQGTPEVITAMKEITNKVDNIISGTNSLESVVMSAVCQHNQTALCLLTCQDFANEYNMKFNAKKSKYLFYGPNANRPRDSPFSLNCAQIELLN
jgi:hypothetical protein